MAFEFGDPATGELPRVSLDDTGGPPRPRRGSGPFRLTLKLLLIVVVVYFALATVVPGVRKAASELRIGQPDPARCSVSALEIAALFAYTLLTKAALGRRREDALVVAAVPHPDEHEGAVQHRARRQRRGLGARLPADDAVGRARAGCRIRAGHRRSRIGRRAQRAVLGLADHLDPDPRRQRRVHRGRVAGRAADGLRGDARLRPARGPGPRRAVAALDRPQAAAQRGPRRRRCAPRRWPAGGPRRPTAGLLGRVLGWAAANWLLDAAALWVFLRAFGVSTDLDALLVAFGLVNVLAVIPITPGGLGIIDVALPSALVGFGLTRSTAVLGVGHVAARPVLLPDRARRRAVRHVARRAVEHPASRAAAAPARPRRRRSARTPSARFDFAVRFGRRPSAAKRRRDDDTSPTADRATTLERRPLATVVDHDRS